MFSSIELIQIYRSKDLESLLCRAAILFEKAGFPYLILKWTPAPGAIRTMLQNSSTVWDNFDDRLGAQGRSLSDALDHAMTTALSKQKADALACQSWKRRHRLMFAMVSDAPHPFLLVDAERYVIADYSQSEWYEFVAFPVCIERDRNLILIAKTQQPMTDEMRQAAEQVFDVVQYAYRCLKSPHPTRGKVSETAVLSRRELECLQWLAAGKTLTEAACILGISERTLRFHVNNARDRLGVATTMQAVVAAALSYGFDPSDTRRSVYTASRRSRYSAA